MANLPPSVRIYKTNDPQKPSGSGEEMIITDDGHRILYDSMGIHPEPREELRTFSEQGYPASSASGIYQPGVRVHRWNVTPQNSTGILGMRPVQMIPKIGMQESFPSIVSVAVVARAKYDELSRLYLTQTSEYERKVNDAVRGPSQKMQAAREEATKKIQELEKEMGAAVEKIAMPAFDLESLLK